MNEEDAQREEDQNSPKSGMAEKSEGHKEYRRAKNQIDAESAPEPDFQSFLAGLYTQTLASLGDVENPMTGETEKNLSQAQYIIDTIGMLKEKTEGNLGPQERQYLLSLLQDLRMRYVRAVGTSGGDQGDQNSPPESE